jgi:neurofibromin 1
MTMNETLHQHQQQHHTSSDTCSNHSNTTTGMPKSTNEGALPSELEDPPALEESLAKYIVSIMSRFMHQMSFMEERESGSSSHTTNITRTEYYTSTSVASISSDIIVDIYKAVGRVIFYVSASNWHIMFIKIKTRILYLTTTLDENPNFADLRLLECCALNSKRLSAILVGKMENQCI